MCIFSFTRRTLMGLVIKFKLLMVRTNGEGAEHVAQSIREILVTFVHL